MTNYNDGKRHFRANVEESNEKAASQLILKDFFKILNYKLVQFKGSLRLQFKALCSISRLFMLEKLKLGSFSQFNFHQGDARHVLDILIKVV